MSLVLKSINILFGLKPDLSQFTPVVFLREWVYETMRPVNTTATCRNIGPATLDTLFLFVCEVSFTLIFVVILNLCTMPNKIQDMVMNVCLRA